MDGQGVLYPAHCHVIGNDNPLIAPSFPYDTRQGLFRDTDWTILTCYFRNGKMGGHYRFYAGIDQFQKWNEFPLFQFCQVFFKDRLTKMGIDSHITATGEVLGATGNSCSTKTEIEGF